MPQTKCLRLLYLSLILSNEPNGNSLGTCEKMAAT